MERTKICKKCGKELPIDDFYKNKLMSDGYVNQCKDCQRKQMRERYLEKTKDVTFIEKERIRSREKFARLYKGVKSEKAKIKEKKYSSLRNAKRDFDVNISSDFELHHWNYNFTDCVIVLDRRLHHRFHSNTTLDVNSGIYYYENQPLDTIEKHLSIIQNLCNDYGFDYSNVKVLYK